jgi:tight adherence protein B
MSAGLQAGSIAAPGAHNVEALLSTLAETAPAERLAIMVLAGAVTAGAAFLALRYLYVAYAAVIVRVKAIAFRFTSEPVNAEVWVASGFIAAGVVLALLLAIAPNPLFAFFIWLALLFLPRVLVEVAWSRRRRRIDEQLAPAIASLCNCVKAGLTVVQAIERLADQAPAPIRTEFRIMANRYAYGVDLGRTLEEAKERLALQNFNLFATALLTSRELGGDVSETLDRISVSLEKLRQMRRTVAAHTSEGRMNIKVLLAAPVLILLLMCTVDAAGVGMLFSTPQGWCVLMAAGLLAGLGVFWASKIVSSEV